MKPKEETEETFETFETLRWLKTSSRYADHVRPEDDFWIFKEALMLKLDGRSDHEMDLKERESWRCNFVPFQMVIATILSTLGDSLPPASHASTKCWPTTQKPLPTSVESSFFSNY